LWFGLDDAAFAGGGALIGLGGRAVGDLLTGRVSSWRDYVGAAVGGAVAGETLLYTANPIVAGAAGGLVSNLTTQAVNIATGVQCEFDFGSTVFDTSFGALTGLIPGIPKIRGVNAGRGSAVQVFRQMGTKAAAGQISRIRPKTAAKMAGGAFYQYAFGQGAAAGALGSSMYGSYAGSAGGPCGCQ
jgi:type VI secretion system secreted protein VgrG